MLHKHNPVVQYLPENLTGRDFVVGDLHGCTELLGKLLQHVNFDKNVDRLMSVGDLVDRGPDSAAALELIGKPWFHCVLGNHEDLARYGMLHQLAQSGIDIEGYDENLINLAEQKFLHVRNGGEWLNDPAFTDDMCIDYIHKISALPLILVVGKDTPDRYHVVHSEILSWDGRLVSNQYIDSLQHEADNVYCTQNFFWGRNLFGSPNSYMQMIGGLIGGEPAKPRWQNFQSPDLAWTYCGHTPKDLPMIVGRQINIDTCAFYASYIDKERNGTKGLTIADPKTWTYWTINGASGFISEGNLGDR